MSLSQSSFMIKNDGTLWGCGFNGEGQLGLGDKFNRTTFTKAADDVKSVCCGFDHTIILKNNGTLWGCGYNNYGELGVGDASSRSTFTQAITKVDNVKSVYCGLYNTSILKNDGTLWACGYNGYGQLGLGNTAARTIFTKITDDVKSVCCGHYYTLILKNDDTLWGCGQNDSGQLGLGDTDRRTTFTKITNDVKSVYSGFDHTIILKNDGTLWGCGYNGSGQLGLGDLSNRTTFTQITVNTNNIKSIYCGSYHTFILKNNGILFGCGANGSGELGLGDTVNRKTFTIISMNSGNIRKIYCGYNQTLTLKNDGTLWGCGSSQYGQLGLENTSNKLILTQITTNIDYIKCLADNYDIQSTIRIYDTKIGYTETLDTNNFRNIPVDKFEKLKVLHTNPIDTYLNCLISFDKKQTWKMFDGLNWNTISDVSPQNIISNGMEVSGLNSLDKKKLIAGGFTGDLDFKIAMKTNNKTVTSSVTKIYIEYK